MKLSVESCVLAELVGSCFTCSTGFSWQLEVWVGTGDWVRIEEGEENQGVGGCLSPSLPSLGPLPAFEGQPLELFQVSGVIRDLGPCVCPLQPVSGIPQLGWKGSPKPAQAVKALCLCPSAFSVEPGIPAGGEGLEDALVWLL